MRLTIIFFAFTAVVFGQFPIPKHPVADLQDLETEWANYKIKFKRSYCGDEQNRRKLAFTESYKFVREHNDKYNNGKTAFWVDFTEQSDYLPDQHGWPQVELPPTDIGPSTSRPDNTYPPFVRAEDLKDLETEWANYKVKFYRNYYGDEERRRKEKFTESYNYIKYHNDEYNRGKRYFSIGFTELSDYLPDEPILPGHVTPPSIRPEPLVSTPFPTPIVRIEDLKDLETEWANYKIKFNRRYSEPEESRRKAKFTESYNYIKNQNAKYNEGESSFWVGFTEFSDYLPEETVSPQPTVSPGPTRPSPPCTSRPVSPDVFRPGPVYPGPGISNRPFPMEDLKDLETEWINYKIKFNRRYPADEESRRKAKFTESYNFVKEHNAKYNAGQSPFWFEFTELSDYLPMEPQWFRPAPLIDFHPIPMIRYPFGTDTFGHHPFGTGAFNPNHIGSHRFMPEDLKDLDSEWADYKIKYNKRYCPDEEQRRKGYFNQTYDYVKDHNAKYKAGQSSVYLTFNELSDSTPDSERYRIDPSSPCIRTC